MRSRVMAVLLGLAATGALQAQESVSRLAWLSGCWEMRTGPRVTLEMWMPPDGGLMIGGSRTLVSGVLREYEQVRIREANDRLVYEALPSEQAPADFPSVRVSDTLVVFENLAHDFPQRILYRRVGTDSIVGRIEGRGRNGPRGIDFPMRRVSCDR